MGWPVKLGFVLAVAALAVTPLPRRGVEQVYARGLYPALQPRLTALSNATSVAIFDIVAGVLVAGVVLMWVVRLRRRRAGLLPALGALTLDSFVIAAGVYVWFLMAWGLNYQREPLRASLDFREERITGAALRALAEQTIDELNARHADAHAEGWPTLEETAGVLGPAFARAQRDLSFSWEVTGGRPKRTLLNAYFTRVSIDGMTDPFFLETLANDTLLPFERAATIAHEWGHLAGYADESEASFVGWLACMRGSAAVRYSGWLSLYGTVVGALPEADRPGVTARLAEGPRRDVRAIGERIRRQTHPAMSRAGHAMYDRFLKANRVEAGVRSYAEVLRLLLGTRFHGDGSPVLRGQTPSPPR